MTVWLISFMVVGHWAMPLAAARVGFGSPTTDRGLAVYSLCTDVSEMQATPPLRPPCTLAPCYLRPPSLPPPLPRHFRGGCDDTAADAPRARPQRRLVGLAVLALALRRFRPLPPGWFPFSTAGAGRWLKEAALCCLSFPAVFALTRLGADAPAAGVEGLAERLLWDQWDVAASGVDPVSTAL